MVPVITLNHCSSKPRQNVAPPTLRGIALVEKTEANLRMYMARDNVNNGQTDREPIRCQVSLAYLGDILSVFH